MTRLIRILSETTHMRSWRLTAQRIRLRKACVKWSSVGGNLKTLPSSAAAPGILYRKHTSYDLLNAQLMCQWGVDYPAGLIWLQFDGVFDSAYWLVCCMDCEYRGSGSKPRKDKTFVRNLSSGYAPQANSATMPTQTLATAIIFR